MLTKTKAHEMLRNPPRGQPLSKAQRGYFGAVASGRSTKHAGVGRAMAGLKHATCKCGGSCCAH